jgi:hypothetical protein
MPGNQDIVVNMLQELNKKVDGISKETTENSTMLRGLNNCMYGKGSSDGLIDRFNNVEKNQEHCQNGQKSRKVDFKWVVAIIISVLAFFKEYFAKMLLFLVLCLITGCTAPSYQSREWNEQGQLVKEEVKYNHSYNLSFSALKFYVKPYDPATNMMGFEIGWGRGAQAIVRKGQEFNYSYKIEDGSIFGGSGTVEHKMSITDSKDEESPIINTLNPITEGCFINAEVQNE